MGLLAGISQGCSTAARRFIVRCAALGAGSIEAGLRTSCVVEESLISPITAPEREQGFRVEGRRRGQVMCCPRRHGFLGDSWFWGEGGEHSHMATFARGLALVRSDREGDTRGVASHAARERRARPLPRCTDSRVAGR